MKAFRLLAVVALSIAIASASTFLDPRAVLAAAVTDCSEHPGQANHWRGEAVGGGAKHGTSGTVIGRTLKASARRVAPVPSAGGGRRGSSAVPDFPGRFGSLADARAFVGPFIDFYNHHHRYSGIGYHTPASVNFGTAGLVRAQRALVLDAAHTAHPERFVNKRAESPRLPGPVGTNQPKAVN